MKCIEEQACTECLQPMAWPAGWKAIGYLSQQEGLTVHTCHQWACAKARGLLRMQSFPPGCSTILPSFWKHLHRSANASVFHVLVSRCLLSEFSWFLQGTLLNRFHFFLLLLENWRISPKTPRKCNPKVVSLCLLGLIFDWRFSLPWLFLH